MDIKQEDVDQMFAYLAMVIKELEGAILEKQEEMSELRAELLKMEHQYESYAEVGNVLSERLKDVILMRHARDEQIKKQAEEEQKAAEQYKKEQKRAADKVKTMLETVERHKEKGICVNRKNGKFCQRKSTTEDYFCKQCYDELQAE